MSSLGTRKDLTEEEEAEKRLIDKVELKDSSLGEVARPARGWPSVTSGDSAQHRSLEAKGQERR